MDAFWPGPLTLVLPKRSTVPACVTAGLETVAVRMPSHPIARALIEASGVPVAAPSANLSGKPSPTDADHVIHDLKGRVDAIVCGQASDVGLESTVLDVTGNVPMILRPGGVTREDIIKCVGKCDVDPAIEKQLSAETAPKSPGMKYTHYAPDAELIIIDGEPEAVRLDITNRQKAFEAKGLKVGIMTCDEHIEAYTCALKKSLGSRDNLNHVASRLFSVLRDFDKAHVDVILAEGYSREGIGHALMNRMLKAAGHHVINV
jgi:L-threonylcarbamoyladenylate synthase